MQISVIVGLLCLLLPLCGCEEQEEDCEVLYDDGYFLLDSLDMEFYSLPLPDATDVVINATLLKKPLTGASELLVLRDNAGNDYRFKLLDDMDWAKQLDGLQLGKAYRFVFSADPFRHVVGMKVFDGELLLYIAASYSVPVLGDSPFKSSGLEGFAVEQLHESKCKPVESITEIGQNKLVSLVTSLPVVFKYGNNQSATLYPTQEAKFTTSQGEYVVHLLRSIHVDPQNYEDGGYCYSFYIKRLQE